MQYCPDSFKNEKYIDVFNHYYNEYKLQMFEQLLVLDNVRFHNCIEIQEFLRDKKVITVYLPDLNPIEYLLSSIKKRLNTIRSRAIQKK